MKVLAVASSARLGGAELSLAEFLRHRPPEAEVHVLTLGEGPLCERLSAEGLACASAAGLESRPGVRALAGFARTLGSAIRRLKPDVILAVGIKAASLSVPVARALRVPIVWQKVDFSHDARLARPLALAVNGVIAVSQASAEALGPLRARRLRAVVGPPVRLADLPYREPASPEPTIGTLAALAPYKGQQDIISAAALLTCEFPQLRVILAGAPLDDYPAYPEQLRELAASLGLSGQVEQAGFRSDAEEVIERLDVFVNATFRDEDGFGLEGLSGAMLEASWVGRPVVATRGGGTPEGVLEGVTGTLVEARDPAALAGAIAPYLRDRQLAERTGRAGRQFARERFAPQHVAERLFEVLREEAERR